VRFNRDETKIAFTVASDTSPSDVFVADLATGAATRLTTSLNPAIDEHDARDNRSRPLQELRRPRYPRHPVQAQRRER
jgi:hypothetical protein